MKHKSRIDQVRESLRLQQIYNVFMRYGMDILLDRGMLGDFRRFMQEKIHDPPYPLVPLSTPVRLRLMLQELGPIYVKMGQVISSRAEVLPLDWQAELNKLQSNVPPFPIEQVREIIVEELGAAPEELFATFDPKPLAAASTAQVHRATLADGQEVVVKVQRPKITTQAVADLGIMQNAARVLERRLEWAKEVGLVSILNEFGANVIAELDYAGEAYNAGRLSRNMERIPGVHIPIIYSEFSTSRVLTMEFISGIKITNLQAIEQAGLDRQAIAKATLHALVKQLLVDGFFHGDPHPGNVLVNLETGVVTFLDTGMVGELDFNQRLNLINLLLVIRQRDARGMAQVMLSLSTPFREVDEKAYYRDFQRQIGRFLAPGSEATLSGSVNLAFDLLRTHGLRLDPQLTLAIKALLQTDAITHLLIPGASVVQLASDMIQDLLVNEVTVENVTSVVTQQVTLSLREIIKRVPTLQEATIKWLEQYEKGRFTLHVDTTDLAKQVEATRSIANQVIVGIMLVGMIIGSSIAASVSTAAGDFWSFMPQLAFIGYTASMIIAGVAVLRLIWRLWRGQE